MIFQTSKTYGGYEVESRTKCFVTFEGCSRKKISLNADGVEQVKFDGTTRIYGDGRKVEIEAFTIAAFEDVEINPTPAPAPVLPTINDPVAISGANEGEQITVRDAQGRYWQMVSADSDICVFELVQHREIGCTLPTRFMLTSEVQALFGWDKPAEPEYDRRYMRPCADGFGIQVYNGAERTGYALAEPIWYKRTDDPDYDRCAAMAALERSFEMDDLNPLAFTF